MSFRNLYSLDIIYGLKQSRQIARIIRHVYTHHSVVRFVGLWRSGDREEILEHDRMADEEYTVNSE